MPTEFNGPELCKLSAREAVKLLKNREIQASDLLDASLQRIEEVESAINAIPLRCEQRARAQLADLKKTAKRSSSHLAWLAGLPIAIKDLSNVSGVVTSYGSSAMKDHVPSHSDPLIERLESRGGIIVGKTNTPEFGAGGNTFNDVYGYTRNPWDISRNAGGSSGGAAASLASGEVWLSQGSDLAGSLRTPAAYCGVVGFRPSPGRAGGWPTPAAFLMEGISGPMARDVEDTALFLDAMCGFDAREPLSMEEPLTSFQQMVARGDSDVKIAFSVDQDGFAPVELEMRQTLTKAMQVVSSSGIIVEEACPKLPNLHRTYSTLRGLHYGSVTASLPPAVQQHFKETLKANLAEGLALCSADIFDAMRQRTALYHRMRDFLQNYDVLAIPVMGATAGPVEEEYPASVDGQAIENYVDWLRFSFLATTTALPALSMPVSKTSDGMPIGLQLIGPPRGEAKLLQVARAIEIAVGFGNSPIDPRQVI